MSTPKGLKGAADWLPPDSRAFDHVEGVLLHAAADAGYERVRTPVFERTDVFARGVGASTDVVQKEMYTFTDKGGRSLTLRPEGTAGVMRAALEANVPKAGALPVKWSYSGEFFRQERPQAGRQRQFNQVGIEALGSVDPVVDAETVLVGWEALQRLGIPDVTLHLNTLGDRGDRAAYDERLNAYLDTIEDLPPEVEARRRLNPLRAFDSKAPGMAELMANAPVLPDHVSDEAKAHHAEVVALLEAEGVPLRHDPHLVRGLDYYTRTTFEFKVAALGAQDTVMGGGRYDGLAEDLGASEPLPGVGWACGVDRTLLALRAGEVALPERRRVRVFVVTASADLRGVAFAAASELRRAGVPTDLLTDGRSLRAQFKAADRSGAQRAVVVGEREVAAGVVTVRDLRTGDQREVPREALLDAVRSD
jgi:histidyl-tRNA synthetase